MSVRCCQAEGCTEDLVALGKPYFIKKKICEQHMRALEVHKVGCGDSLWRFCQQCGRLEPLANFDGTKRNCRASLSRRKVQPHDFLSSNSKLRKHNSDQCSKQQKSNKQKSCATSEAAAATDDDTLQGFDSGFEAATAACAATAYAGVDMCFAEQPGAYLQAEACNNGMTFDYVYSQIQQQQQQQLQLEQQLHSAMTTCADTCTADFQTFTAAMQPAGVEGSSSASPVGLQADLFGRIDSVCSVSGGAADAMQAHVESVMMAELMAELSKAQQEQQQQQMQHVGFTQLAADEPCDASSRTLPTLPVLAQPNPEQQQQALLAQQVLQQQQQQQQAMLTQQALQQQLSQTLVTHSSLQPQQQQTLMTQSNLQQQLLLHKLQQSTLLAVNHQPQLFCQSHCHSSSCRGCMAAGCAATAVPAANITMSGIRTAAGVNCLDGSGTSVAAAAAAARAAAAASLPAAAVALPVGLAGTSTLVAPSRTVRDPAAAQRLKALTTQMSQMQAMLEQMQQSLEIVRRL